MTAKDTFALISASLSQGDLPGACSRFFANREALYQENPLLTLKTNFELRFISEEFEEAYEDNEFFQALPYVSQEVEEYLRDLPRLIRANELSSFQRKPRSEEATLKLLVPTTKNEELLFLVSSLGKEDIVPYEEALIGLLTSEIHDDVKTFILMLLVSKNVNKEVTLLKRGETFVLNPSKIGLPFQNASYDAIKKSLQKEIDVGVAEIAGKLLDQIALCLYPHKPVLEQGEEATAMALLDLARHYLNPKSSLGENAQVLEGILASVPPLGI